MSTGERYFALVINFASAAAVSRILTPDEIGVSAIGMAVLGIALSVREFASSSFLIQRSDISREDVRATFSVMLVLTAAIAVALSAGAPLLAAFYKEEKLVPYFRVISVCLFVDLVCIQILTLLRRDMAFGKIAVINTVGLALGAAATIVMASLGFSYMSFAWAWLLGSSVTALLALSFFPHLWIFKPSFSNCRGMIAFGGYNGAISFMSRISDAIPVLLLGRSVSPHDSGLFSRSLMICQIPSKLVFGGAIPVALPAFSAAVRQGKNLAKPYLRALEIVTVVHWPALLLLIVLAHPAVEILLGSQWRDVVPLVRIAAAASLFAFGFELNYPVIVSMGAIRDLYVRSLIVFPVSAAVMTVAVLSGGLHAAVWSMMFIVPFQAFVTLAFVRRRLAISWADFAWSVRKSAVTALASAVGPVAVTMFAGTWEQSLPQAVAASLLAAAGWFAGLYFTKHPLFAELMMLFQSADHQLPRKMAEALPKD